MTGPRNVSGLVEVLWEVENEKCKCTGKIVAVSDSLRIGPIIKINLVTNTNTQTLGKSSQPCLLSILKQGEATLENGRTRVIHFCHHNRNEKK